MRAARRRQRLRRRPGPCHCDVQLGQGECGPTGRRAPQQRGEVDAHLAAQRPAAASRRCVHADGSRRVQLLQRDELTGRCLILPPPVERAGCCGAAPACRRSDALLAGPRSRCWRRRGSQAAGPHRSRRLRQHPEVTEQLTPGSQRHAPAAVHLGFRCRRGAHRPVRSGQTQPGDHRSRLRVHLALQDRAEPRCVHLTLGTPPQRPVPRILDQYCPRQRGAELVHRRLWVRHLRHRPPLCLSTIVGRVREVPFARPKPEPCTVAYRGGAAAPEVIPGGRRDSSCWPDRPVSDRSDRTARLCRRVCGTDQHRCRPGRGPLSGLRRAQYRRWPGGTHGRTAAVVTPHEQGIISAGCTGPRGRDGCRHRRSQRCCIVVGSVAVGGARRAVPACG